MAAVTKQSIGLASARAAIVLVPSYTAAWLTDKMVYVVPTLAAASFFAASIAAVSKDSVRNIDDSGPSDDADTDSDGTPDEVEAGIGGLDG